jgi:hypothetical protein
MKKGDMGGTCNTHGKVTVKLCSCLTKYDAINICDTYGRDEKWNSENLKGRVHLRDLGVDVRIK